MAAATRGLTPADLTTIREALAAGRKPKVAFTSSAGQMAGNSGHVVELTDPTASDEWIVVQFGRDQLPFSPADLAIPVRGAAAKKATEPASRPTVTTSRPTAARPAKAAPVAATKANPRKATTVPAQADKSNKDAGTSEAVAKSAGAANGGAPERTPRPARAKAPTSLTVTVTYAESKWTVAAQLGTKALAKPYVIKPTEALRMIALIDVPGVHDAVETIIAAERAEAEQRAVRLREELAEIESRLAELTR